MALTYLTSTVLGFVDVKVLERPDVAAVLHLAIELARRGQDPQSLNGVFGCFLLWRARTEPAWCLG